MFATLFPIIIKATFRLIDVGVYGPIVCSWGSNFSHELLQLCWVVLGMLEVLFDDADCLASRLHSSGLGACPLFCVQIHSCPAPGSAQRQSSGTQRVAPQPRHPPPLPPPPRRSSRCSPRHPVLSPAQLPSGPGRKRDKPLRCMLGNPPKGEKGFH